MSGDRTVWYFDPVSPYAYLALPGVMKLTGGHVFLSGELFWGADVLPMAEAPGPSRHAGRRKMVDAHQSFCNLPRGCR